MQGLTKEILIVKDMKDPIVKYASMLIRYNIYFTNKENFISTTSINILYEMVKKGANYDLCELLRENFLENP